MKTKEEWQIIFKEQEASGLSVQRYCSINGINKFAYYNAKARGNVNTKAVKSPTFTKVNIKEVSNKINVSVKGLDIKLSVSDLVNLINELS